MKTKLASVLAFEKKLCCSDALMFAGSWKNRDELSLWSPIKVNEKVIRGTTSNRFKSPLAIEPAKLDADTQKANIQMIDYANLTHDSDSLKIVFTMRVLGDLDIPSTCNEQDFQKALKANIGEYLEKERCKELASRYAENIANGRFLWRNRIAAEKLEIRVSLVENEKVKNIWIFDGCKYSLQKFSGNSELAELAEAIQKGLLGDQSILLKVEAVAMIGSGQEIYPSQELVRDSGSEKYKKSKVLYSIEGLAAMHSQKIGNAIRTIDTWFPQVEEVGPIAVEPYGSVTNRGIAYRQPKDGFDFYTLFDKWILKNMAPTLEQQHYVVACLIRGGVFGGSEKD